jgi:hypothetical protein
MSPKHPAVHSAPCSGCGAGSHGTK